MNSGAGSARGGNPGRGFVSRLALAVVAGALSVPPNAAAQPLVAPRDPYAEVARRLEPWVAAEVEAKALPALSIALVDDQQIVWARGFGFADRDEHVPATADMVCAGRLGLQAVHGRGGHATSRTEAGSTSMRRSRGYCPNSRPRTRSTCRSRSVT